MFIIDIQLIIPHFCPAYANASVGRRWHATTSQLFVFLSGYVSLIHLVRPEPALMSVVAFTQPNRGGI